MIEMQDEVFSETETLKRESESPLPPLYAKWADELLGGPIPQETAVDCAKCVRLAKDRALPLPDSNNFHPRVKCCTYYPTIPNYLAGRILCDPSMPALPVITARIEDGFGITPLYMIIPPVNKLLYTEGAGVFGRTETLRCPYYMIDAGCCGVWKHRYSICATWFCKYRRGSVSYDFWKSMLEYFALIEEAVSLWCAGKLDLGLDALELSAITGTALKNGPLEYDMRVDPRAQKKIWGNWFGKEKEYFIKCGELVENLSWNDIEEIGGIKLATSGRIVKKYYAKLLEYTLPERLKLGSVNVVEVKAGYYVVSTYSGYDRIEVPAPVFEALRYFDGGPVKETMARIKEEQDISFDDSLLQMLVDFNLLVSADETCNA